jgi:drug/metabolite transporter (DMT)-like permease
MSRTLAVLALVFNATTWGLAWWPIRMLTEAGLHPLWATAIIYAVATAGLALVMRGSLLADLRAAHGLGWLVLASGLTNASFNWAVTLTDVARVALLFYLMPVWAALLARWLLKEPLSWLVIARIAVALAGAAFVFLDPMRPAAGASWLADGLAVLAGMTFAANTVLLRRMAGQSRSAIAVSMFSGAAVTPLLVGWVLSIGGHALPLPSAPGIWMLVLGATALAYLLGNLALQYGAGRLPANTTSLIMLTEVVVAAASAALIAGEVLSSRVLIGGALIVAAAASSVLLPGRKPGQPIVSPAGPLRSGQPR